MVRAIEVLRKESFMCEDALCDELMKTGNLADFFNSINGLINSGFVEKKCGGYVLTRINIYALDKNGRPREGGVFLSRKPVEVIEDVCFLICITFDVPTGLTRDEQNRRKKKLGCFKSES